MSTLVQALRAAFLATLIVIFLLYFGIPSYQKFSAQETIFVETRVQFNLSRPPAIKIAVNDVGLFRQLNDCVSNTSNYDQAVACFEDRTCDKTELFKYNYSPSFNNISIGKLVIFLVILTCILPGR